MKLGRTKNQRGSATLIVLILLLLLTGLMMSNSRAFQELHQELRLTEKKQMQKYSAPPAKTPVQP
jgi:hypothetical protein